MKNKTILLMTWLFGILCLSCNNYEQCINNCRTNREAALNEFNICMQNADNTLAQDKQECSMKPPAEKEPCMAAAQLKHDLAIRRCMDDYNQKLAGLNTCEVHCIKADKPPVQQ